MELHQADHQDTGSCAPVRRADDNFESLVLPGLSCSGLTNYSSITSHLIVDDSGHVGPAILSVIQ